MKSIFVMTYYHLLHAAALAMTFEERPALYVEQDFLKISDAFLERIRATDIFAEVHGIRKSGFVHAYNAEIVRTKDLPAEEIDRIGTDIFERWLEPFYARVFADADEDETFYSYNDHQSCIYYIHKHFRSIVGVEDGYKVLESKIAAAKDVPHDFYVALSRFYGKYYPEPMWKNSKVERILSSCAYGGDDPYYRQRVEVLDFFDLVEQNRERFLGVLGTLFDLPEIDVPERSSLVLTQPLARAGYCTLDAYYLLLRKLIRTERARGNAVYLKPHPAEELHMGMFRHEVDGILPKEMPSEVLNYLGARFGRGVSFNSASLSTADYLAEAELLYREKEHTYEGFQRVIQQYVRGERIWLDLYVKVRKLEPGRLVDALSCLKQGGRIRVRVHIVLSDALFEEGVRYFSAGSVGAHVREYLRRMRDLREPVAWRRRLLQLDAVASRALADGSLRFLRVQGYGDKAVFRAMAAEKQDGGAAADFVMLTEGRDSGRNVANVARKMIRKRVKPVVFFENYTRVGGKARHLGFGMARKGCTAQLTNRLLAWSVVRDLKTTDMGDGAVREVLARYSDDFSVSALLRLYVEPAAYQKIEDGEAHYGGMARALAGERDAQLAAVCLEFRNWLKVTVGAGVAWRTECFVRSLELAPEQELCLMHDIAWQALEESGFLFEKIGDDTYARYAAPAIRFLDRVGIMSFLLRVQALLRRLRKRRR